MKDFIQLMLEAENELPNTKSEGAANLRIEKRLNADVKFLSVYLKSVIRMENDTGNNGTEFHISRSRI